MCIIRTAFKYTTNQEFAKSSTRTSGSNYPSAGGIGRWGARAEPLPSFSKQSISNHFQVQSTLAILLFNETNNKVKIKPTVICQREMSCFFICPTVDFHWCGNAMYFRDIQTPRSQFKRGDKFGLTRHKDIPH